MGKFSLKLNLMRLILSSFLASFCTSQRQNFITSCLINHHVTNFSMNPTSSLNQSNSTSYFNNILFYSLQNLLFTQPKYMKPTLIILPSSKEQLVETLLCSKKGGYKVNVRSGGHSFEGLSSITFDRKPFVIIDLMNLDQVKVDLRSKTAWVEGGATLGQVYYTIANQSKGAYGFSAGSCPTVGIGGHISGGGFGLLSRKYGLSADNVVDALLVDSEGRVLDRTSMGEDVFWALRGGGGGSFGIVYAWKINLLDVPPKVTTFQAFRGGNIEDMSQLVQIWQYVGPFLDDKFYLSVYIQARGNGSVTNSNISISFIGQYLGPKHEAISILNHKFPQLRIKEEECNEMSWIESVLYFSNLETGSTIVDLKSRDYQPKDYFKAKSDYVRTPIPIQGVQGAMNILVKEPNGYILLDPYGAQMARIHQDSIPFPHRKGNLYGIQYYVSWDTNDDPKTKQYMAWIRKFYEYMTPYVSSNPRAAYINYLDLDLGGLKNGEYDYSRNGRTKDEKDAVEQGRVWGEKYFLTNYERLVKAKTLIDPCDFFHHALGIPPSFNSTKKCLVI